MAIETTINIHLTVLKRINEASLKTGESRNSIIVILLRRAMADNRRLLKLNCAVRYQERDPFKQWHCFHVRYREDTYEFCQDMRKFYKLSVSRILAYSVIRYLSSIIMDLTGRGTVFSTDNYPYNGLIIIQI